MSQSLCCSASCLVLIVTAVLVTLNPRIRIPSTFLPAQVGADGKFSRVRGQAGIPLVSRDYGDVGVVATVKHTALSASSVLHEGGSVRLTTYQEFLDTGPLALLPLSETSSSIVWTLPASKVRASAFTMRLRSMSAVYTEVPASPRRTDCPRARKCATRAQCQMNNLLKRSTVPYTRRHRVWVRCYCGQSLFSFVSFPQ
jgi:hypothetical protein